MLQQQISLAQTEFVKQQLVEQSQKLEISINANNEKIKNLKEQQKKLQKEAKKNLPKKLLKKFNKNKRKITKALNKIRRETLSKSLKIIRRKLKKNIKRISSLKNGEQKLKLHVELNNENINRKDSLLHAFAKTISKVSVPEKKI